MRISLDSGSPHMPISIKHAVLNRTKTKSNQHIKKKKKKGGQRKKTIGVQERRNDDDKQERKKSGAEAEIETTSWVTERFSPATQKNFKVTCSVAGAYSLSSVLLPSQGTLHRLSYR